MEKVLFAAPEEGADEEAISTRKTKKEAVYPRVTIRLIGDLGEAIDDLQQITHSSTPSEVIRRAILVYHTLVKQKMLGNETVVEKKEGNGIRRIPVFL